MSAILIYVVKVCISSGLFWLYFLIALRNKPFHTYNRFYLLFSAVASLLIPLVNVNWLTWESSSRGAVQFAQVWQSNESIPVFMIFAKAGINWSFIMLVSLVAVSMIAMSIVLLRVRRIYNIKQQYPVTAIEGFYFINTDIQQAPFSFLNNLFWRKDLPMDDAEGKMIMQHELTHITQKHSVDKLFMQLLLCLFWMNPFFWIIRKELAMIHEFIADERSVENKDAAAFAAMLLNVQLGKNIYAPAQPFNYSPIKRRLLMLTKSAVTKYSYARRFMVAPLLLIIVLLSAFKVQQKQMTAQHPEENKNNAVVLAEPVDPAITPQYEDTVKPQKKSVTGNIANATTSGTVSFVTITDNKSTVVTSSDNLILKHAKGERNPLCILDGEEVMDINIVNPSDIESVSILKNSTAIAKYGDKAVDGVIEIITKKYAQAHGIVAATITTVNGAAGFAGGAEAWRKFLGDNMRRNTPVENGAKAGKYTVVLDFQVAVDGTVSDIRVQSNPGYGTGEEAARVMSLSPKWTPATLNDMPVLSRQKQAITFVVE